MPVTVLINISNQWLGGSPRVTLSQSGHSVTLRLIVSSRSGLSGRARQAGLGDTPTREKVVLENPSAPEVLEAALTLAEKRKNTGVWDCTDLGVAELHGHCQRPVPEPKPAWWRNYQREMIMAIEDGNSNVRFTAQDVPVFVCQFPRHLPNGDWWYWDNCHLSENRYIADNQMQHSGLMKPRK